MEFENYADVIDAFERDDMGYGSLTDYINGENIKIKEIEMSPMDDLAKALSSKKDGGLMVAIERFNQGGLAKAPYERYTDESMIKSFANGGGVGSMMQPKKNFKMQGGVRNYLGNQKQVKAPLKWQSSPDHPKTELAYITKKEKDLLVKKDLHGSLKGSVNRGPSGIISLNGYGSIDSSGRDVGMSGAATSDAESGRSTANTRAESPSRGLPPGVVDKALQGYRDAFINAGGGQRVNPGFFDSRDTVSPAELASARAARNNPNNVFGSGAYRNTRGGIMNMIKSGGIFGNLIRGLGRKFGLGKNYNEATYDNSEFNNLGLLSDRVNPMFPNDLNNNELLSLTNSNIDKKPRAIIKGPNIPDNFGSTTVPFNANTFDDEVGNRATSSFNANTFDDTVGTKDPIRFNANTFDDQVGTRDPGMSIQNYMEGDAGMYSGLPNQKAVNEAAMDVFRDSLGIFNSNTFDNTVGNRATSSFNANTFDDTVGTRDPEVTMQEYLSNAPVGGLDQYAREMEALESARGGDIVRANELGGTLQDFYTNKQPYSGKFKVIDDNIDFNDQASLPGNNMVAFAPGSIKDRQLKQAYGIYEATGMEPPNLKSLMQEDIDSGGQLSLPQNAYSMIG